MNTAEVRAEYVRRAVADWPPLSEAQLTRIAVLLGPLISRPGGRHG